MIAPGNFQIRGNVTVYSTDDVDKLLSRAQTKIDLDKNEWVYRIGYRLAQSDRQEGLNIEITIRKPVNYEIPNPLGSPPDVPSEEARAIILEFFEKIGQLAAA